MCAFAVKLGEGHDMTRRESGSTVKNNRHKITTESALIHNEIFYTGFFSRSTAYGIKLFVLLF